MKRILLDVDGDPMVFKTVLASQSKTVRQVLAESHVDYVDKVVLINGFPIYHSGLDNELEMLPDRVHIHVAKEPAEWMPRSVSGAQGFLGTKAFILGCCCVIISALTVDELREAKLLNPERLRIPDPQGNPVFGIDLEAGPGSITGEGAVYGSQVTSEGKPTITMLMDAGTKEPCRYVLKKIRKPLRKLAQLEQEILRARGVEGIPEEPQLFVL